MTEINAKKLKTLRDKRNLTLDALAQIAKVDRGTISKIETGKRMSPRASTLRNLAAALNVEPTELQGPDLNDPGREPPLAPKAQMNFKMASDARNALNLTSIRYNVKQSHILHLAPFLFYWAAEQSLKLRQEKLHEINEKLEALSSVCSSKHLSSSITDHWRAEDLLEEERRSIANRDIFGAQLSDDAVRLDYEESEQNPMAQFFASVAESLGENVEFEHWSPHWSHPGYTLGKEEALYLVGGDEDAAHYIVCGTAPLHELPKDVRDQGSSAVAKWATKLGDARMTELEDLDLASLGIGGDHD
ncbi:helix-turn-helix domain-containing protein [Nostoc sp. CHAB 5834]|nr:helix-turn-helix domain-containing protein [Nostoc sp. CHAB 5834]